MNNVSTPSLESHCRTALATNSGPLSDLMWFGMPSFSISSASIRRTSRDPCLADLDRQALAGELVDHRQELQGPAFAGPLEHEVVRPHVVAIRRSELDTGPVIEPQPTALGMSGGHLQLAPDPALACDSLACQISIAAELHHIKVQHRKGGLASNCWV